MMSGGLARRGAQPLFGGARWLSTAAAAPQQPAPPANTHAAGAVPSTGANARHRNIRISPRKLNDLCRLVRGLPLEDAVAQMSLHRSPKAIYIRKCLQTARNNAVNNYNLNGGRLVVCA